MNVFGTSQIFSNYPKKEKQQKRTKEIEYAQLIGVILQIQSTQSEANA